MKQNFARFPEDFSAYLREKQEVVTNCDHLARLEFSKFLTYAFTEHRAIMAATILSSLEAIKMSVFIVRAFVQMREQVADNTAIRKRSISWHHLAANPVVAHAAIQRSNKYENRCQMKKPVAD